MRNQKILLIWLLLIYPIFTFCQLKADFSLDKTESCDFLIPVIKNLSKAGSSPIKTYTWDLAGTILVFDNPAPPSRQFFKTGINTICLTVTDQDNNTNKKCQNIIIYTPPKIDITSTISSGCAPLEVEFKNNSFSPNGKIKELTWNVGGTGNIINTTNPNQVIKTIYTSPGPQNVTVRVVDEKNCVATKTFDKIVNVITPKPVTPIVRYLQSCQFPWKVLIENTGLEENVSYEWIFSNGQKFTGSRPDTLYFNKEGEFDLEVLARKNECIKTFKFDKLIKIGRERILRLGNDTICSGGSVPISTVQTQNSEKIAWYINNEFVSSKDSFNYNFTKLGCNKIVLVRTRLNCVDTIQNSCFFVRPRPQVKYAIEGNNTCLLPAKVNLKGEGSAKWQWRYQNNVSDSSSATFNFDRYGDYTVHLTVSDSSSCTIRDSFPIKIKKFEVDLPKIGQQGCSPQTFFLNDSIITDVPIVKYNWKIFTKDTLKFNDKSPFFTIRDTGRFDVELIVQNAIGCIDTVTKSKYIGVGIKPKVKFDGIPRSDCRKTPRKFTDLSSDFSNYWFWEFGDGGTSLMKNPEYKYNDTGYFDVKLTVGHNGCIDTVRYDSFMYIKPPIVGWEPVINCEDPLNVKLKSNIKIADTVFWVVNYLGTKPNDTIRQREIDSLRFPDFGKYFVGIYGENYTSGCTDEAEDTLYLTNPIAFYQLDKYVSCIPLISNITVKGKDIDTIKFYWQDVEIDFLKLQMDTAGIYPTPVMIGKDRYGCPDTFQIDSVLIASELIPDFTVPNAVCIPDTFKAINTSISKLGTINQIKWTMPNKEINSADSLFIFHDKETDYPITLEVANDRGCVAKINKNVIGVDLKPKIIRDSLGCTKGDISLAAGGTTVFTKSSFWSLGDGNTENDKFAFNHRYKSEGKFEACLTLFDERGCSKKDCDSILVIDPIANFYGDSLEANCPPLITNFTNLSKNANQYFWSFGDNSISDFSKPSHIYNKVDTFDVMLIASNSPTCHDTLLLEKYIKVRGPRANITPSFLSNCTPLIVKVNIESDKPYTYLWDNDIGNVEKPDYTSTKDSRTYTYTKPGKYKPRAIVTNDEGCSLLFQSPEFEVNEIKSDFELEDFPLCAETVSPVIKNKTTSTAPIINHTWILERPDFSAVRFDQIPVFTIQDRGYYKLTLISEAQNCIDTAVKEQFVYVGIPPKPDFEFPDLLCQDKIFTLKENTDTTLQGKLSFTWKDHKGKIISNSKETNVNIDTFGNLPIKLIVKNEANCIDSISKVINVKEGLKVKILPDTIVCIGEPVNIINKLSGNNIKNYQLISDDKIICENCKNYLFIPEKENTYFLKAENAVGCLYKDSIKISVAPVKAPEYTLTHADIICKDSLTKISISPLLEDWSTIWTNAKGDTLCKDKCTSIVYPVSTTDQLRIKVINNRYLCSTTKTSDVKIESSIPDFLTDSKTVCLGDTVRLTAKDGVKFNWNVDGYKVCDTCKHINFVPDRPSLVVLNLVSSTGCPYKDSVRVNVFDRRLIYAGPDTMVCKGADITLKGWGFGAVQWSPAQFLSNANSYTPKFKADSSMFLKFSTINDECVMTDSLFVQVIPNISLKVTDDTICPGEIANIQYESNANLISYNFSTNPQEFKILKNIMNIYPENSLQVFWTAKHPTCKDVIDTSYVVVKEPIRYFFDKKYYEVSLNNIQQVKAKFDKSKIKNYTISWQNKPGLSCYDCAQPFISDINDNQTFKVIVTDPTTGCFIEDSIYTRIKNICTPDGFFLPNIMRLSSVSGNNKFDFNAHKIEHFKSLQIFDRWGNKVFQTEDANEKWDGIFDGEPVTTGVYVVKITANCPNNLLDYVIIGDVTILP